MYNRLFSAEAYEEVGEKRLEKDVSGSKDVQLLKGENSFRLNVGTRMLLK